MCTVFAESEVISLIGRGEPRENIARGVIESVVSRVATMAGQAAGAQGAGPDMGGQPAGGGNGGDDNVVDAEYKEV